MVNSQPISAQGVGSMVVLQVCKGRVFRTKGLLGGKRDGGVLHVVICEMEAQARPELMQQPAQVRDQLKEIGDG